MRSHTKPPRTKGNDKPADAEDISGERQEDTQPEEGRTTENGAQNDSGNPSREEVISTWRKPITNQDEQEKITDDGGGDIPIQDV